MRHPLPIFASYLLLTLPLLASCGGGGAKDTTDAFEQCDQGNLDEGYRLLKVEAADPAVGVTDATLGRCLAAAVVAADERGEWKTLPDRLSAIQSHAGDEPGPELVSAEIEARAALAHARCTDRLCCFHDGLTEYQTLRDAVADGSPEHKEIVERWYAASRDELLREGQWVVELDGRMAYAPTVSSLVPTRPEDAFRERLGQEIVLNNVLLMTETKGISPQRSGDRVGRDLGAGLDPATHRKAVVRRPGAADGTVVAAVWSDAWEALFTDLEPGVLHSCRGTAVEVQRQGKPAGLLVLQDCTKEQKRTDKLFRQRKCTVCGVRDDQEVCHDGYGRNDGQAFQQAAEPVCNELLLFDETLDDCQAKIQMNRWCSPNDDPAPAPQEPATGNAPDTAVDPS